FGATFEQIANITLQLEARTGVATQEIVQFLGDIAPVVKSAGFEMEEFATIAAVATQRSARSASSIAEQFGRILPTIDGARSSLLELAQIDPAANTQGFLDAV